MQNSVRGRRKCMNMSSKSFKQINQLHSRLLCRQTPSKDFHTLNIHIQEANSFEFTDTKKYFFSLETQRCAVKVSSLIDLDLRGETKQNDKMCNRSFRSNVGETPWQPGKPPINFFPLWVLCRTRWRIHCWLPKVFGASNSRGSNVFCF